MTTKAPWPERDEELRTLAAAGLSYYSIAGRMGLTANQVIGRAHRLALPARGSPLKPAAERAPAPSCRRPMPARRSLSAVMARPSVRYRTCQHIAGEPAGRETLFCGDPTQPGSPYCAAHHAMCHVDLVEDEAA
jgi:GcrA cell cycle regulator